MHYRGLCLDLPVQQPVFGLEAAGLSSKQSADSTLEKMANRYITAVLEVHPAESFSLAGWSSGGLIAFEMAR